ncbi:protein-disulfide reductase DsbD [Hydrogenophaga sp. MI9]|uniref:protein-disulfide reductase DsbD n=1 Tax=Hydrogenophaga sp. MI9 TaxID=3453719 RepID=UPI003EE875AE
MRVRSRGWTLRLLGALFGLFALSGSVLAEDFLPPEQAFVLTTTPQPDQTVRVHWQVAPGYHLYRDRISFQGEGPATEWKAVALPKAKEVFDSNFNRSMAVYTAPVDIDVRLVRGTSRSLTIGWQGCADDGLCYPPESRELKLEAAYTARPAAAATPDDGNNAIARALASGSLLKVAGAFLVAGLLLAFTPCVLPMVPILSSLIAGQGAPVGRARGFLLSLSYSVGMALVYAAFGVAAGLAGEGLAAFLQNPWVLGAFAVLLSAMALSMFGVYELQMPSFVQTRATQWSNRFSGGSFIGVFLMGGVSALVVGPCVAAPLAGALVYISQTKDVVMGGVALFVMAMGMSVPLLLVGLSAGSLLPRAGTWMEQVKKVFGMVLFGVAIWLVSPVLPPSVHMLLWAAWALAGAALLGLFGHHPDRHATRPAARAVAVALGGIAAILLVGAASGGNSVLQPLAHLRPGNGTGSATATEASLPFQRIKDLRELDATLAKAGQEGQRVMLDFYADWCVACKEFETLTFSQPEVRQRLSPVKLLQVDVTANNSADRELLKRYGLFGPPGVLFFNPSRTDGVVHKVIGFQNAQAFQASLDRALTP